MEPVRPLDGEDVANGSWVNLSMPFEPERVLGASVVPEGEEPEWLGSLVADSVEAFVTEFLVSSDPGSVILLDTVELEWEVAAEVPSVPDSTVELDSSIPSDPVIPELSVATDTVVPTEPGFALLFDAVTGDVGVVGKELVVRSDESVPSTVLPGTVDPLVSIEVSTVLPELPVVDPCRPGAKVVLVRTDVKSSLGTVA